LPDNFPRPPRRSHWRGPRIKSQSNTLIAAPTGSGKTLAAFLAAIDDLVRLGVAGQLDDTNSRPLRFAAEGAQQRHSDQSAKGRSRVSWKRLRALRLPDVNIRTLVRTGDTPPCRRTHCDDQAPAAYIVVTTPESLYILLTSVGGRRLPTDRTHN